MDIYVCSLFWEGKLFLYERIDAVGGRDDATELSTAERYNPKTNQWSSVVAMNSRRSGVRCRRQEKRKSLVFLFIFRLV
jgi:hypothetical protein